MSSLRLSAEDTATIPNLLVCPEEMQRFLRLYEGALEACDGSLGLFRLPGAVTFASRDTSLLAQRAARWAAEKLDVYIHIHLHALAEGEAPRRGSIDTVRAAIGLFSDIDARGPGRKKPPETLCPTVADAVSVVEEFNELYNPLVVSLVVGSGHGCYPAILFKEPLEVETAEDKKLLEWLGRRFHRALHIIAAKRGWVGAVDYCDIAKVLRLPGCVNYKDANNPQPVRLLHESDARHTLSSLEDVLPPLTDERRLFQGFEATSVDTGSVAINLNVTPHVDPVLLKALRENHPEFGPTWDNHRPDLKDQSCSGYDLALANIGVACGLTDQQIVTLIDLHRREFPRNKQDRRGAHYQKYLQTTIGKARFGKLSSAESKGEWDAIEAALNSPAPVPQPTDSLPPAGTPDDEAMDQGEKGDKPAATSEREPQNVGGGPASAQQAQVAAVQVVPAGTTGDVASTGDTQDRTGGSANEAPAAPVPGQVRRPTEFLLAKVRATGNVNFVYDNIALVAALSDAQVAVLYQELKPALGSKLNYNHFNKAVRDARACQRRTKAEQQGADSRPIIRTDDRLLDEIAAEAIAALETANQPPVVFRRGGAPVFIHPDEDGRPVIMRSTEAMMRGRLARVAKFMKETRDGLKRVSPPEDLTRDVLASNDGHFPPLGVLTQIPILRPDGTFRMEPGYDPTTRAYYLPTPGFTLAEVPEKPTRDDAQAAVGVLREAIGQFPFDSAADEANCLALLLTPILRVTYKFKTPLALIDAPKWGTGKTLLGMLVYVIATGSEGTVCAAPTNEEEWRKRMMSILERGSAVVIIDNVDATLRSPALSAVLTAPCWEDRVLGRSEDVRLPNVSTWIATGNNLTLGAEMARRAYRIRLDAGVSNPAKRTGFTRTDQELLTWAAATRGNLLAALLTIIRAWWIAGQPRAEVPAFGSFNNWAQVVGGILAHAGVQGFLTNLESLQNEGDEESQQWEHFLVTLVRVFHGCEFTVADIVDKIVSERGALSIAIPDEVGHPLEDQSGGLASFQRRLGKALARKCGTRFGEFDLRIERGRPDRHTKVQRWRVAGDIDAVLSTSGDEPAGLQNQD